MMNRFFSLLMGALLLLSSSQLCQAGEENMIKRIIHCTSILRGFNNFGKPISHRMFANAKGIAILDIDKGGLFVSGTGGEGILVIHNENGWSAPSAISTGGVGFGLQVGFESSKVVLLLNDDEAVQAFSDDRMDKITLGSDVTIVAGPDHEGTEYETISPADIYSYKMTTGDFFGVAVDGTVLSTDADINYQFYGKRYLPSELLSGKVARPEEAQELYDALYATAHPALKKISTSSNVPTPPPAKPPVLHKRYYYGTPSYESPDFDTPQPANPHQSQPPPPRQVPTPVQNDFNSVE